MGHDTDLVDTRSVRRWAFKICVGLSLVGAGLMAVAAPIATYLDERTPAVALAVPPLVALMLLVGLGWFLTQSTRLGGTPGPEERQSGP